MVVGNTGDLECIIRSVLKSASPCNNTHLKGELPHSREDTWVHNERGRPVGTIDRSSFYARLRTIAVDTPEKIFDNELIKKKFVTLETDPSLGIQKCKERNLTIVDAKYDDDPEDDPCKRLSKKNLEIKLGPEKTYEFPITCMKSCVNYDEFDRNSDGEVLVLFGLSIPRPKHPENCYVLVLSIFKCSEQNLY